MKKFFKEFKEFITRGNVLDMAVGIIVGSAFTAIITALVSNILNPLLAMIPGMNDDGLGALQVVLRAVYDADGVLDVSKSVIMDFGAVISAIITFILTAFVLFLIIKTINTLRNKGKELAEKQKKAVEKMKKKGEITEQEAEAEEAKIEATAATAPAEPEPAVSSASTDELLREIRDLLKAQNENKE